MSSAWYSALFFLWLLTGVTLAETSSYDEEEVHCLARNLYWEVRSEDRPSLIAVGWVVLNRVQDPDFPNTACKVVHEGGESAPCEFSWWCDGESDRPQNAAAWDQAQNVALQLLRNPPPDTTDGALWYHHVTVSPEWASERTRTVRIGEHYFYRKGNNP